MSTKATRHIITSRAAIITASLNDHKSSSLVSMYSVPLLVLDVVVLVDPINLPPTQWHFYVRRVNFLTFTHVLHVVYYKIPSRDSFGRILGLGAAEFTSNTWQNTCRSEIIWLSSYVKMNALRMTLNPPEEKFQCLMEFDGNHWLMRILMNQSRIVGLVVVS